MTGRVLRSYLNSTAASEENSKVICHISVKTHSGLSVILLHIRSEEMELQPLPRLSFNKQLIWLAQASFCKSAWCAQRPGITRVWTEHPYHTVQVSEESQAAVHASKPSLEQTIPHYHPKHFAKGIGFGKKNPGLSLTWAGTSPLPMSAWGSAHVGIVLF